MAKNTNNEPAVLFWVDLEMTGLDISRNVILEIASFITDHQLNILEYGPNLPIHQPEEILQRMDPWCITQHEKSGLTAEVQHSTITVQQAEEQTLAFVKKYAKPNTIRLCGNSIWQDRIFLQKFMPTLLSYFNYRLIDVTSFKEVIKIWYPSSPEFPKKDLHRALSDILESLEELKYYRQYFFIKRLG